MEMEIEMGKTFLRLPGSRGCGLRGGSHGRCLHHAHASLWPAAAFASGEKASEMVFSFEI
jgi:hypothetical protein